MEPISNDFSGISYYKGIPIDRKEKQRRAKMQNPDPETVQEEIHSLHIRSFNEINRQQAEKKQSKKKCDII